MQSKLSDLADNLSEINNKDCKKCKERKNIKSKCEFIRLKNNRLNYKCKECNETSNNKSVNDLIEKFPTTNKFCNGNLNKFVLLLRKGVYPCEYMDSWERFNEISLPPKKYFCSELNLEDISNKYFICMLKKYVFEIRNLSEYHDLYVQTDTSLLADVSENFRNICLEKYQLDPSHFLSAPGLAWQACLKKTGANL